MTLHLLRDIPREIRDQIWAHTLGSAFGCVCLHPITTYAFPQNYGVNIVSVDPRTYEVLTSEPVIRLKFLRTCSQIHLEARNVLWRCNSLAFPQGQSVYSHSRLQDPRFSYAIESVHLSINLLGPRYGAGGSRYGASGRMDGALKIFGKWARDGSLKSLTLTVLPENKSDRGLVGLNKLLEIWRLGSPAQAIPLDKTPYFAYLARLEELGEAGSYLPVHLKRKIVFDTNWDTVPVVLKREWIKSQGASRPQDMMRELHNKFGGEFWMDGKLCFKDRVEIERVFDIPPEEDIRPALLREQVN